MTQINRIATGLAVSVATAQLCLVGCASDGTNPPRDTSVAPPAQTIAGAPISSAGAPVSQMGAPVSGVGAPPSTGGIPSPVGAAGSRSVGGAAGNTVPANVPGAGGTGTVPAPNVTWTPQSNLDASGNLIAPAPGEGFQIQTTMFDLAPGQEVFNCFHVAVPNDAEFAVGEWDAQMSKGSHHFILYRAAGDTTPSGTLSTPGCTSGFGGTTWLYTQGTPRGHLQFPDGVAMVLAAHERIIFDMHYINTGSDTIHARISLNVNKVKAAQYQKADAQVSFNIGIAIPPNGMQTVGGDCQPVPGAKYFVMQTHTHKRGILSVVNRKLANGQLGEELVRTTNWDNPEPHIWPAEPFLTFQPGESFHYSCTYQNDRASTVTVGTSAELNEMCMAEAYFYPAVANVPACN